MNNKSRKDKKEIKTTYFCAIHHTKMVENGASIGGGGYDKEFGECPKDKCISWVRKWYKCPQKYCRSKIVVSEIEEI